MKTKVRFYKCTTLIASVLSLALAIVLLATGVFAENTPNITTISGEYTIQDPSPAIYVAAKNANSVVGVITLTESWNSRTRESSSQIVSEGSGVVITDGGYILTNYHVVESGDAYQILMPSGEKVDATLTGCDASYDLAVLQVSEGADTLTPVSIGSVANLSVGSTVIAIGNPGGEALSNTVTSGIVSCLERNVAGGNTTRTVHYLQHSAAINSGNSGGGLFDVNGNLVGINTLKYSGSAYSSSSYEGLGFAIPIDTAESIALELIQYGKVQRAALGVTVSVVSGADEPSDNQTPAGLLVQGLTENGPAEKAGVLQGDYITAINGTRVTSTQELTDVLDQFSAGDTVELTIARYTSGNSAPAINTDDGYTRTGSYGSGDFPDIFGDLFGGSYNFRNGGNANSNMTCEVLTLKVTLEILD